jgi:hypothetical protein
MHRSVVGIPLSCPATANDGDHAATAGAITAGSITAAATRRSTGSCGSTHRREVDPELTASYAQHAGRHCTILQ